MTHIQNQNADAFRGLEKNRGIIEVVALLYNLAKQVPNGKKSYRDVLAEVKGSLSCSCKYKMHKILWSSFHSMKM